MLTRTVIITSDEQTVIDNVSPTLLHLFGACPLTRFQELREIFDPLPVGCSLLVRSSSFYVLFQRFLHDIFFRLFLIPAIAEPCSTFLIIIVTVSTYHGNPKASAER